MLPKAKLADIPVATQARIQSELDRVAEKNCVRVLLAVESGSRAWGFASPDSDFDVRFLYVRPVEGYVALRPHRDVIEQVITDELDVNGWDLRKAITLGLSWNPALVEWLTSPIVYRESGWEAEALRKLFVRPMSRDALIRHYLGLGSKQWGRFIDGREQVRLKKYFYVVRPAVALLWLQLRPEETPPMSLPLLVEGIALPDEVGQALVALRERKAKTSELGDGARIPVLDTFIRAQLAWGEQNLPRRAPLPDPGQLAFAESVFHASVFGRGMPWDRP